MLIEVNVIFKFFRNHCSFVEPFVSNLKSARICYGFAISFNVTFPTLLLCPVFENILKKRLRLCAMSDIEFIIPTFWKEDHLQINLDADCFTAGVQSTVLSTD